MASKKTKNQPAAKARSGKSAVTAKQAMKTKQATVSTRNGYGKSSTSSTSSRRGY